MGTKNRIFASAACLAALVGLLPESYAATGEDAPSPEIVPEDRFQVGLHESPLGYYFIRSTSDGPSGAPTKTTTHGVLLGRMYPVPAIALGYRLGDRWLVGANVLFSFDDNRWEWDYDAEWADTFEIRSFNWDVTPGFTYLFGEGALRPYVTAGAGYLGGYSRYNSTGQAEEATIEGRAHGMSLQSGPGIFAFIGRHLSLDAAALVRFESVWISDEGSGDAAGVGGDNNTLALIISGRVGLSTWW